MSYLPVSDPERPTESAIKFQVQPGKMIAVLRFSSNDQSGQDYIASSFTGRTLRDRDLMTFLGCFFMYNRGTLSSVTPPIQAPRHSRWVNFLPSASELVVINNVLLNLY